MRSVPTDALATEVANHPGWYHTIDLPGGLSTPGFCDLRPFAAAALPTSLTGRRVLDVGTFDGFWAFSMEARGAASVQALDLADGTQADWPPDTAAENLAASREQGLPWGSGFALAHRALDSAVERVEGTVYELDPAWLGEPVDLVLCGTILQHLRDPVGALERMRSVLKPGGDLLLAESFSAPLTRRHPRRPLAEYRPAYPGSKFSWWLPNLAALRAWPQTAGFLPTDDAPVRHKPVRGAGDGDHLVALRFTAP